MFIISLYLGIERKNKLFKLSGSSKGEHWLADHSAKGKSITMSCRLVFFELEQSNKQKKQINKLTCKENKLGGLVLYSDDCGMCWEDCSPRELIELTDNLLPQVFVPYCAGFTKRATLESSVTGSILIGLKKKSN